MPDTHPPDSPPALSLDQVADMTAGQVGDTMRRALAAGFQKVTIDRQSARADVFGMSLSSLGGCTRQAAYRIARTVPSDPERGLCGQRRRYNLGAAVHDLLLPAIGHVLGAQHELGLLLAAGGLLIPGRTDLYWPTAAVLGELKTRDEDPGAGPLTPNRRERLQVAGYTVAAIQARQPVAWMVWLYLDRASGADAVVVEPVTQDTEALVEARCVELAAHATDPDSAPREERGPGRSIVCDTCPWVTRCWPDEMPPRTP